MKILTSNETKLVTILMIDNKTNRLIMVRQHIIETIWDLRCQGFCKKIHNKSINNFMQELKQVLNHPDYGVERLCTLVEYEDDMVIIAYCKKNSRTNWDNIITPDFNMIEKENK